MARLDPNFPVWAVNYLQHAYYMVGRYEDAWRVLQRQSDEQRTGFGRILRVAILGRLGRADAARAAIADVLAHEPDASIQGFLADPGLSDDERRKLAEGLRQAGFPACAPATLKAPFPLPECTVAAGG